MSVLSVYAWRVSYDHGGHNTFDNTGPIPNAYAALRAFAEECAEGNRPTLSCQLEEGGPWLPTEMSDAAKRLTTYAMLGATLSAGPSRDHEALADHRIMNARHGQVACFCCPDWMTLDEYADHIEHVAAIVEREHREAELALIDAAGITWQSRARRLADENRDLRATLARCEDLAGTLETERPSSSAWRGAYRNNARRLRDALSAPRSGGAA